jgi:hypothetical protein
MASGPLDPGRPSKPLATKPKLSDAEMKDYGAKMSEFARWVEAQGMPLVYHHHMAAVVETEPELDAFMASTISLLFDAGHSPSRAATCCGRSTSTTSASGMSTPRTCAWM